MIKNIKGSPLYGTREESSIGAIYFINDFDESLIKAFTKSETIKRVYPRIDSYTLYLPQNLDIDQILRENPPVFSYKRDKFVYILSLIYSIPSQRKDSIKDYNGFTPINKAILGSVIKDYRQYINYLKDFSIVEESSQYIPKEKSQGLRFVKKYRQPIKPVVITDWCLIKNLVYLRKEIDLEKTQELHYLKKWFLDGKLNVDVENAKNYLNEEMEKDIENNISDPDIRFNSRVLPVMRLNEKSQTPLFSVDTTARRLHTNLTQLKSELRKYVSYDGKMLCSIDISNSQPFLLNSVLNIELYRKNNMRERIMKTNHMFNNQKIAELERFINSVSTKEDVIQFQGFINSGQFYEEFGKVLQSKGIIEHSCDSDNLRKIAKNITFCVLFNTNYAIRYDDSVKIFESLFPNVYKIMSMIKLKYHPTLAVILQNLEADLILNQTCKIISEKNPEIPLYTLHDSIITTEENVKFVQNEMMSVLSQNLGIPPSIKVEEWK